MTKNIKILTGKNSRIAYYAGDYAFSDNEGYFWLLGRSDDVLKVSGHRLGTMELESAFISHKAIAEAAVTSRAGPEKRRINNWIFGTCEQDSQNLICYVENLLIILELIVGPIASPDEIYFVNKLPKTRSGKIMRRLLKSIASGGATWRCNNTRRWDVHRRNKASLQ